MRVLVVTSWFPSADWPGGAPFAVAHAKAIARHHDVRIAHLRLGGGGLPQEEHWAGLPVTRIPISPRRPGAYRVLRRMTAEADVVHSMAFSTIGVLAPLAPVIRRRWVHSEHWSGVLDPVSVSPTWQRLAVARHLLRLPKAVSAVSTPFARVVRRFTGHGVSVVPCVVDASFTASPQPATPPLRLVAVGGLVPGKRPVLAVETLASLVGDGVDARLTWVGDGPLRSAVHSRAAELGLADRVDLVGSVAPDKVADHVRAANVFFLPTAGETFLAAGAEAIACGRPVVLPRTGGFTDYVTPSNGVLADADDPASLAAAVRDAASRFAGADPEALRATVIPRFGASAVADDFDLFYRRLES
ncbi:glycosyltransferase family 4 protein [Labedaea rhizosphaerae]|uniref:Glycosyltransferase involved in cell wall biosynthesis n=1 Tax=Labedaea rhizosphaerae TaxID=598644 RepID=A0A4R6SMH9_LABRH|nr:glycosyltransferase family 4 protein [Labedaea rhizosphaerae]TDQ04373.1 glycosyltransferase involved in cell wall biosynthesis [Labedaea rhizosphaerae]